MTVAKAAKKTDSESAPAKSDGALDLKAHKKRADKAWSERAFWDTLYSDAYEFAIPFRRPSSKLGKGAQRIERLFDSTAVESAFRAAGQLHQDLFPPDFFKLAPGPVARIRGKSSKQEQAALETLERELQDISDVVNAFFQTGEFDAASSEMCIDLLVGTGSLFPVEGDDERPVRFVCIPFDELAIETDAYGATTAIYWRTKLTRRAIAGAFKAGKFPAEFTEKLETAPDEEVDIYQDFVRQDRGKWLFCAWLPQSETPISTEEYLTQPMAVPRYHRVPGEPYGRGPILLAMATIKTLNKAVELMLKSAAIQMLGIWGYRPGGAFNPDTVRLGPGEFWPMQATGGVLGPDVTRLDPSAGKIDVGQLISQELRLQVQSMLGDDRLPEKGATPVSATEIMARMKRIAQNYLGAWARIVNEVHPVIVRRVIEILYRRKLLPKNINIDQLLIKIDVLSPITAAVKAAAHARVIEFIQLVAAVKGDPHAIDLIVKVDDALRMIGKDQMPAQLLRTPDEQKQLEAMISNAVAQIMKAQQQQQAAPAQQPGAAA